MSFILDMKVFKISKRGKRIITHNALSKKIAKSMSLVQLNLLVRKSRFL